MSSFTVQCLILANAVLRDQTDELHPAIKGMSCKAYWAITYHNLIIGEIKQKISFGLKALYVPGYIEPRCLSVM